jgi:catechol 2,3-dioxygenase-like lactoylglutathione lyase family enzyme
MIKRLLAALVAVTLGASAVSADAPKRPRITGVSHIALYVHDVASALAFYKGLLGFEEPYRLTRGNGDLHLTFLKVNDRQCIEIFPEKEAGTDRLYHIALEVHDAEAMRVYLMARGVKVPDKTPVGRIGNANFFVTDPDGHIVEIVQYLPGGWTMRDKGKHLPDTRISARITHVGVTVASLSKSLAFYRDVLGCRETWRGSGSGKQLSWVNLTVPDGEDYIELMLHSGSSPPAGRLGIMHHLCLEVADVGKARALLAARPAPKGWDRLGEIKVGVNRKRQLNLFDPDGTRVELMEPRTVDGIPASSSKAPPPNQ